MGQRYGLTLNEFGHFLHFMQLYHVEENIDDIGTKVNILKKRKFIHLISFIEEIFTKSGNIDFRIKDIAIDPYNSTTNILLNKDFPLMTRSHFTQAIAFIANKTYPADSVSTRICYFKILYLHKFVRMI